MMKPNFNELIGGPAEERANLFLSSATRLGTLIQNIEKDFWVCWILDALFNGLRSGGPRLLFKGGTSLSKGHGLISRFSEDIDITVYREDIGEPATVAELEALSGKRRRARLDGIKEACQHYIGGQLLPELADIVRRTIPGGAEVFLDDADPDRQSLLFAYPAVTGPTDGYLRPTVKIEAGAKSALDPHQATAVNPYVADDLAHLDLCVPNVITVAAERTFWDKIVILHGQRNWFERRGELRHGGQRISRHYYDVHQLLRSPLGQTAVSNPALAVDCARHARMFFNSPDFDLEHAIPGSLALAPAAGMLEVLRRDYQAMSGMIFGNVPSFEVVIESVRGLEAQLNR